MKRFFLTFVLFLPFGLWAEVSRPNVIFLMADDLGYGDVGFNGNELVQTPHMDRMAAEGIRFTQFYSIGPVCSPTRACVQTGRHCMRFGMINVNIGKLPGGEINLAKMAKSEGYATGHFGKWHLGTLTKDPELSGPVPATTAERYGPPWERGYDVAFATETNVATWDPLDETGLKIPKHRAHFWENGVEVKDDFNGSAERIVMDRAIQFVKDATNRGQPFMSTIWFYGPHSPTRAGKALRDLYPNQPLGRQHYLGSITSIDEEIGRLREVLEQLGIEEDTLIFFCSDNGPEGSATPKPEFDAYQGVYYGSAGEFRGRKRDLHNGGVVVPAFAYWPGTIEGGRTVREPVCTLDYLPTMASTIGAPLPQDRPIDGVDMLDLLKGSIWQRDKFIPFASNVKANTPKAAIVHQGYKLCLWLDGQHQDELYDIQKDPGERENLFNQRPELAAELRAAYLEWIESAQHSYEFGDYPGYVKQGSFLEIK
ncbi:sulfatase-like hydrolase/transferase [Opitutaceae bacterium]|nr:sulfatase-like hydrolase/transferase [Opitutaceae bacterium]